MLTWGRVGCVLTEPLWEETSERRSALHQNVGIYAASSVRSLFFGESSVGIQLMY